LVLKSTSVMCCRGNKLRRTTKSITYMNRAFSVLAIAYSSAQAFQTIISRCDLNDLRYPTHLVTADNQLNLERRNVQIGLVRPGENDNLQDDEIPKTESSVSILIQKAERLIKERNLDDAFSTLSDIYALNPGAKGLQILFETCIRLKIELLEEEITKDHDKSAGNRKRLALAQERMGLAAILIDRENYDEASYQLRSLVSISDPIKDGEGQILFDKAASMLYRTNAASCDWEQAQNDSQQLVSLVRQAKISAGKSRVPPIHPFEALKWPCLSLEDATFVAQKFSERAESFVVKNHYKATSSMLKQGKRIKLGYLSPDFTGTHPLAFLMQNVFANHNKTEFEVCIYSLSEHDGSREVDKIKESAEKWVEIPSAMNATKVASLIQKDELDIIVDLCGHSGTSLVMEALAHRIAPVQISYMGFPGSSGAKYIDYLICDDVVVPHKNLQIRRHYTEDLILMPHCYFVNSHKFIGESITFYKRNTADFKEARAKHSLPPSSFVFCCHSRPDKIDPCTFKSWMSVLQQLCQVSDDDIGSSSVETQPTAVIWLLKSGEVMERNLRKIAQVQYKLDPKCLVFAEIAPRNEHLQRLSLADLFLDTPAYNAHTVGCDSLYAGVPMVSLLCDYVANPQEITFHELVTTDKLPSRVGASLLLAAGLEDLIAHKMEDYENIMMKCVLEKSYYENLRKKLEESKTSCPLFDTNRWVRNLETALKSVVSPINRTNKRDIIVQDGRTMLA